MICKPYLVFLSSYTMVLRLGDSSSSIKSTPIPPFRIFFHLTQFIPPIHIEILVVFTDSLPIDKLRRGFGINFSFSLLKSICALLLQQIHTVKGFLEYLLLRLSPHSYLNDRLYQTSYNTKCLVCYSFMPYHLFCQAVLWLSLFLNCLCKS